MNYAFEKIDTVAGCNALLELAQKKKQTLERRRRRLGEAIDNFRDRLGRLAHDRQVVQQSLLAFIAAWQSLPEGIHKAKVNVTVKRLELRLAQQQKRALTCNASNLLRKEMKYNLINSQVASIDRYIAAVQRLRAELGRAAARTNQVTGLRNPVTRNGQTVIPQFSPAIPPPAALSYHTHPDWQSAYSNARIPGAGSS